MENTKNPSTQKWSRREYHVQHNKYVEHQLVKIYCATNQFLEFQFLGTHNKPHGVHGLVNNYHIHFDLKIGHGTCAIWCIPCACTPCNYILDQPWVTGIPSQIKP